MIEPRVVKRYAAALYAEAEKEKAVDLVESDLGLIGHSLETMPNLESALMSPLIPASKKRQIAGQIFSDKIHQVTLNYLYLLIDKRREEIIKYTETEFIRLANEARGVTTVRVTSAVELTEGEVASLQAKLSGITGKKVELVPEVDPAILGGVIVRIGDRIWDGSVTGHLSRLREQLLGHETE